MNRALSLVRVIIIQLILFIIVLTLNPLHFSAWLVQVKVHVSHFSKPVFVRHTHPFLYFCILK